jgi:multidrug efflux pump subunit AcrB
VLLIPLSGSVGSGFLPEMDEGSMILDYVTPPGTSLAETDRILRLVEREIDTVPEIEAWSRRTGDQLGFFITEPNTGDYVLKLRPKRKRSADEIADGLRERIAAIQPTLEVEFGQLVEDVIGDLTTAPQPIELRLFSEDRLVAEQRGREAATLLEGVRGVVDVKSGVVVSGPNAVLVPGTSAVRAGLGGAELGEAVEPYVGGVEAGVIQRGARAWPVRVTLPLPAGATGPRAILEARVPVAKGRWVRLGELAALRIEAGDTEIHRDNQRTMVAVTARLSGRDLGSAIGEIRAQVQRRLPLGAGTSVSYGGQWAEQQSSFRGLAGVLLGAAAAVLLVLLASFRSWLRALAVLGVAVCTLPAVFVALWIGGATFNVASFVGAIMMVGIVAENGYFLVAEHDSGLREGLTAPDAAYAAARRRARPVLMTSAAGIAALAPLALGLGSGSALLRPLAIAVVGGFTLSAALLLLVLPAMLAGCRLGREEEADEADRPFTSPASSS